MFRVLHRIKFLFMAPLILPFLVIVNLVTWNGEWWVQWAAFGIGIAYSAAKAGAAHFMRNAALELARYNILVNAIAPGPFVTNIGDGLVKKPEVQQSMAGMIPLGRLGDVEEMKALALFLASPASSFMTGAEIFNDGGLSLGPPIP